jgi:poly-gamma-glutamate synthesis protein (capsule biosynthesis protein)
MPQVESARQEDSSIDFRTSFAGIKSHFDRADIAIVNLETTISHNSRYSGYPCFASPAEYADALAWLGVDVALLANNHCCDKGARGVLSTIAKLDTLGIAHTGLFHCAEDSLRNSILRFERNGIKLSLLNYTYGTNGNPIPKGCAVNLIDTLKMANDIAAASVGADCVVACVHWGYEYQRQPSRSQRQLAQLLHRNGVDIVVGSHPHVVQPYAATESEITIFSLGNFVSNQRDRYTDGGLLAEIEIVKESDTLCRYSLRTIPIWVKVPGHRVVSSDFASDEEMTEAQRADYNRFIDDTERLLKKGVKL